MHPFANYPIISDQINPTELAVIIRELRKTLELGVNGDVVEFGCYIGTTSLFLQRTLRGSAKTLHAYDSFAGLPAKTSADASPAGEQFTQGELFATKAQYVKNFKRAGLPVPVVHKAWFEELTDADLPPAISFAFLDGDFYASIMASLKAVWPRLAPGAIVVVDDYQTEALPGVAQALKEWRHGHSFTLRTEASLAVITRS